MVISSAYPPTKVWVTRDPKGLPFVSRTSGGLPLAINEDEDDETKGSWWFDESLL